MKEAGERLLALSSAFFLSKGSACARDASRADFDALQTLEGKIARLKTCPMSAVIPEYYAHFNQDVAENASRRTPGRSSMSAAPPACVEKPARRNVPIAGMSAWN